MKEPQAESETAEHLHGPRALVIDDNRKLLQVYEELLTGRGFAITTCDDSSQAISLLKAQAHDVVLLDIQMPGLEGTDLLPLIKQLQPELPVIVVSAYCDDLNRGYYHALGAFEIVGKPFSHTLLLNTIDRAVARQERIPFTLTSLSLREGREQVYRTLILSALQRTKWNQVKAAELLGVSRYCLIRWIKKLGIVAG